MALFDFDEASRAIDGDRAIKFLQNNKHKNISLKLAKKAKDDYAYVFDFIDEEEEKKPKRTFKKTKVTQWGSFSSEFVVLRESKEDSLYFGYAVDFSADYKDFRNRFIWSLNIGCWNKNKERRGMSVRIFLDENLNTLQTK